MFDIVLNNPLILFYVISIVLSSFAMFETENLFLKGALGFFAIISCFSLYSIIKYPDKSDGINTAKMFAGCKLLEENNYNGIFSENTNKLDCNGVIKNVPISDYEKSIELKKTKG